MYIFPEYGRKHKIKPKMLLSQSLVGHLVSTLPNSTIETMLWGGEILLRILGQSGYFTSLRSIE
jgi:hypothetical protein